MSKKHWKIQLFFKLADLKSGCVTKKAADLRPKSLKNI